MGFLLVEGESRLDVRLREMKSRMNVWPVSPFSLLRAVSGKVPQTLASQAIGRISAVGKLMVTSKTPKASTGEGILIVGW